jgi:outer membrane protein OmpA-like peptidoglycan-associated protein
VRPLITPTNLRRRFWKRALGATVAGLLCFLLLLPALVSELLRYQLPRMGLGVIEIGNIDINLFRGRVVLEEVALYKAGARGFSLQHLELDLSMLDLLEQRIHIQSLIIEGLSLTLRQNANQPLQIAGVALPQTTASDQETVPSAKAGAWRFGIDAINIRDGAIQVIHPQFTDSIQIDHFTAGPLAMWRPEFITPVSLGVGLREGMLRVEVKSNPFAAEPLHRADVTIKSFPLASIAKLAEPKITGLQGALSTRMQIELQQHATQPFSLSQQGEVSLAGLQLQSGNHLLSQERLHWNGTLKLADITDSETVRLNGALKLAGISVKEEGESSPAVSLHGFSLTGLQLTGIKQLTLEEVAIDTLVAAMVRRSSGIALVGMPAVTTTAEESGGDQAASAVVESEPFKLRIDRVRLSGDSRFTFDDKTVKPPFHHAITITEGELQHIDTSQTEQLTTVMLRGRDDYYTKFSVDGNTRPFAPQLAIDLKAKLNDFDMPPTSPYLAQLLGYRITTGQVDSDVTMQVENNLMKSDIDLRMNQLKLEPEDPARIEDFQQKTTLPLNTALSLLRDSDDNIKLKLSINGKLDDPQFNLNDIINTALGKSLKMASVSYLKLLLQPYGSLITVIQMAGKAAGRIQLDPVTFAAGSAELSAEATPYLTQVSKLLEKKSIHMQLCGFATMEDLTALSKGKENVIPPAGHPALEALAKQRAESIKSELVNNHGVLSKQLFVCHPELDRTAQASPRAELSI